MFHTRFRYVLIFLMIWMMSFTLTNYCIRFNARENIVDFSYIPFSVLCHWYFYYSFLRLVAFYSVYFSLFFLSLNFLFIQLRLLIYIFFHMNLSRFYCNFFPIFFVLFASNFFFTVLFSF